MSVLMPLQLLPGAKHFQVIEEPAYLPNGSGEHLYVDIEKESLTTDQVAEALAKACGKKERDVGYGGRKDRHAVTRQWFSVHFGDEAKLATLAERLPGGQDVRRTHQWRRERQRWPRQLPHQAQRTR